MVEVLVRNLDVKAVQKLKKMAAENGRSLNAEIVGILEEAAARGSMADMRRRLDEIAKKLKGKITPGDVVKDIHDGRERK
jgi:plasmid stability protein